MGHHHQFTLPPPRELSRLRRMGLTYREIARFYDVPGQVIKNRLENGRVPRVKKESPRARRFWQKTSTALALIRRGYVTYGALQQRLGYRSKSATYYFIQKLIAKGWVTRTPGKAATLRLTPQGQQIGTLIVPVRQQSTGDLEECRYPPTQASGNLRPN